MDCSPPDSSVHGISQARILEWVAIFFSRGSSQPRDWTCVSCIAGGLLHRTQILYRAPRWHQWDKVSIPGSGRSPGGENALYSSILPGRIPWTEEPGGLQSIGSQRVRHDWVSECSADKNSTNWHYCKLKMPLIYLASWISQLSLGYFKCAQNTYICLQLGKIKCWISHEYYTESKNRMVV